MNLRKLLIAMLTSVALLPRIASAAALGGEGVPATPASVTAAINGSTITPASIAATDGISGNSLTTTSGNLSAGTTALAIDASTFTTTVLSGHNLFFGAGAASSRALLRARSFTGSSNIGSIINIDWARGTSTAPTALQNGDFAALAASGYGATAFGSSSRASMFFTASQNWTDTAQGMRITFNTTQSGSLAPLTRLTISDNGNIGIGTTTPSNLLTVAGNIDSYPAAGTGPNLYLPTAYGTGNASGIIGRMAGGTLFAPTFTPAGNLVAFFSGRGHIGSGFVAQSKAGMFISAAEDWTTTANGMFIDWRTTAIGTTTTTERMRLTSEGSLLIGTGIDQSTFTATGALTLAAGASLTVSGAAFLGVSYSTQAAGASGDAVTVSCPAGSFAEYGGCDCGGITAATSIINRPNSVTAGSIPTGHTCQIIGTVGGACAAFVRCSVVQ